MSYMYLIEAYVGATPNIIVPVNCNQPCIFVAYVQVRITCCACRIAAGCKAYGHEIGAIFEHKTKEAKFLLWNIMNSDYFLSLYGCGLHTRL